MEGKDANIWKDFFLLLHEKVIILKNDIMDKLLTYIPIVIRHKMNHKVLVVSLPKTSAGIFFLQLKFVKNIVALIDKQLQQQQSKNVVKGHEESFPIDHPTFSF